MAEKEQDGRRYDIGDVIAGELEVVAVSYKEDGDRGRYAFSYATRDHREMQDEREAEEKLQRELEATAEEKRKLLEEEAAEEQAHRNDEVDKQKEE